jgi:hypothetical protein
MQPPKKQLPWLVLCAALLGLPAHAAAQAERADTGAAPCVAGSATCTAQPIHESVERTKAAAEGRRDEAFLLVNTAFIISASTDLSVSMYQIGRGAAREGAFGAQWQDSPIAFAVSKSALAAGFAYGLQRMHRSKPKTALVLGIAATALECMLTVRSARMAPPP